MATDVDLMILLAEDGHDTARFITSVLTEAGLAVELAENGRVAVDLLFSRDFDLVLMDMQMPVLDGCAATREIRLRGSRVPIIALTAEEMMPERARAVAAGVSDYLIKPIEPSLLLRCVAKYLPAANSKAFHRSTLADTPRWQKMVEQYTSELPTEVATLSDLLTQNKIEQLTAILHQIKGSGGNYGFPEITRLAAVAEKELRQFRIGDGVRSLKQLMEYMRNVDGYNANLEKPAVV